MKTSNSLLGLAETETLTWTGAGEPLAIPSAGQAPLVLGFLADEVLDERFRIVRFLGQGGMGQVFEAEDLELGVRVALKAVRPERCHSVRAQDRFRREVHLARQVTHRNVCRIFDLFQLRSHEAWGSAEHPQLLVTMELLEGETLSARLRREGPMATEEALPIIRDLATALDTAHGSGVLHLDFKSSNVILTAEAASSAGDSRATGHERTSRAVVTDFGLACASGLDDGHPRGAGRPGTPVYSAPEMAAGDVPTAAADVYSFGVVIFEMLTGNLPFEGSRTPATGPSEDVPASPPDYRAQLPAGWAETVRRCLELAPEDRFASAGAVVAALERKRLGRWRHPAIATIVAAVGIGGWLAYPDLSTPRPDPEAQPATAEISTAEMSTAETATGTLDQLDPQQLRGPELGPPTAPAAQQLFVQGSSLLAGYDLPAACDLLQKAAVLAPESAAVFAALAHCWDRRGYGDRALEWARQAVSVSASLDPEAQLYLRTLAAEMGRQLEAARQGYEELWSASPETHEYGLRLALARTAHGDPVGGLEIVDQVRATLEPSARPAQLDLVEARAAQGRGALERQRQAASRLAATAVALNSQPLLARARLLEGEALDRLGRRVEAIAAVGEARWIYESRDDDRGLAWSGLALQAVVPMATSSNVSFDYSLAVDIFRQVGDPSGEALALARWGRQLLRENESERSGEVLDQSIELAQSINNLAIEAEALNSHAVLIWAREDTVRAAELFAEAEVAAARSGNVFLRSRVLANLGNALMDLQQLRGAKENYAEALAISTDIGTRYDRGMLLVQYAWALISLGEVSAAEKNLREAVAIGEAIPHEGLANWATQRLSEVDSCHGRFDAALAAFDRLLEDNPDGRDVHHVISRSERLIVVAPDTAEQELRAVAGQLDSEDDQWTFLRHQLRLAWALLDQGKNAEANVVLDPHRATLTAYPEPGVRQLGLLLYARMAAAAGRVDEALDAIDSVAAEALQRGAAIQNLTAQMHKVRALHSASRHDQARITLAHLTRDATRIGCPGMAMRAQLNLIEELE